MAAQRIGLLGGTFDPPHAGHLAAARACVDELGLDRLLLVVANCPWQKVDGREVTPAEDRYAMAEAAAAGADRVEVSRIEIERGGPSYTVDTVEELRRDLPGAELFLVVGGDLVPALSTWHRWEDLRQLVTLAVVTRPGSPRPPDPPGWRVVDVDGKVVDVSSSEVRRRLEAGEPLDGLVPDAVVRCIRARSLYAVGR